MAMGSVEIGRLGFLGACIVNEVEKWAKKRGIIKGNTIYMRAKLSLKLELEETQLEDVENIKKIIKPIRQMRSFLTIQKD